MQLRNLLIRLTLVRGMPYRAQTRILQHCVHTHAVVTDGGLLGTLGQLTAQQLVDFRHDWQSVAFEQRVQRHAAVDVLTIVDPDYPPALLESYHPPLVLFIRGNGAYCVAAS
ncbi:hypothetical protein [Lactiplantibacillus carotarum]|uniref:hypothetical protein n=1 Tax=Lactiplantibacillus carotarum TaxID=2993456 RepID=UPI00298EE4EF|nr:hypothetical protein [Lactiplantibacillus carotarum]